MEIYWHILCPGDHNDDLDRSLGENVVDLSKTGERCSVLVSSVCLMGNFSMMRLFRMWWVMQQITLLCLLGKNLKKLKMRKFFILWYLCQSWSNSETNASHNVKFDARLFFSLHFFSFIIIQVENIIFHFLRQFRTEKMSNFEKKTHFWKGQNWSQNNFFGEKIVFIS